MTRHHASTSALSVLSCVLLLVGAAACSAPNGGGEGGSAPPLIEVVSQPEHTGEPISLDIPLHSSGAFEFEQWPSACDLTDEATLRAVLPGAGEFAQQPEPGQMKILNIGGGSEGPFTIPEARCTTSVGFDVDGLRLSDGNVVMNLMAEVHQAGDPEYVEDNRNFSGGKEVQIGDTTCVSAGPLSYKCATENVVFSIMIDARPYEQYTHTGGSIYLVDGEEIDFSDDIEGFNEMAQEKILKPVVEIAVARLSR